MILIFGALICVIGDRAWCILFFVWMDKQKRFFLGALRDIASLSLSSDVRRALSPHEFDTASLIVLKNPVEL